jgi:hypothetical protein
MVWVCRWRFFSRQNINIYILILIDKTGNIGLQMEPPRIKPEEKEKPV